MESVMEEKKRRHRRTAEERLADLERKRLEALEKHKQMLEKIEEEKRRLSNMGSLRKMRVEQQRRFQNAVLQLFPDWDYRHFIAVIADMSEQKPDMEALAEKGEALLNAHGKSRRGRRPKASAN